MNTNKLWLPAFILMVLAQLYVPASMIFNQEAILKTGTEFKFKAAPIDPLDPFRGKYIVLNYDATTVEVPGEEEWGYGETVYVIPETDSAGFAKIKSVHKTKPTDSQAFLTAEIDYTTPHGPKGTQTLTIDYPFDRYYMEESKAYAAEEAYREAQIDTAQVAYALVSIKDGESVIKDVFINDTSIREVVKQQRLEEE